MVPPAVQLDPRGETHEAVWTHWRPSGRPVFMCECGAFFNDVEGIGTAEERHQAHVEFRMTLQGDTDD